MRCIVAASMAPSRRASRATRSGRSRAQPRADQHDRVVGRDHAAIVAQHAQVEGGDAAVGRKRADHVDLASRHGLVHQRRVHAARHSERKAVGVDQRAPLGSRQELVVRADLELGRRGASSLSVAIPSSARAPRASRARRCSRSRARLRSAMPYSSASSSRTSSSTAAREPGAPLPLQHARPQRSRVVDVDVDLAVAQRVEEHRRAERRQRRRARRRRRARSSRSGSRPARTAR